MSSSPENDVKKKLEAISTIVDALQQFTSEETADIISFALKHLGKAGGSDATHMATVPNVSIPQISTQALAANDIASFVGQKEPKNEYQRIAVIAYFLFKTKGVEDITTKDINDANTDARQPRFSNISTAVNRSVSRYKYLTSAKRGVYRLSYSGEQMVESLPDQGGDRVVRKRRKSIKKKIKDNLSTTH